MSNITMKDVEPYFAAYAAQYGGPCTLSVDVMEELMSEAATENAMLIAMHEAMTSTDETDIVIGRDVVTVDNTPGSAYSYAIKFDAAFERDIDVLAQAALENKRGAAVILLDLYRLFGHETVEDVWPVPGTWKPGHGGNKAVHAGDNEPWDKEDTSVTKADGTSGKGTKSFYADIVALSAHGAALLAQREATKSAVGDVKVNKPKASAIDTKLTTFKGAIGRAVNLGKKMAFVNKSTEMMAEIILGDDGKPEQSNKLIFIRNKKDASKFDVITIGQFLALKVSEGATYAAITGTTKRAPRAGQNEVTVPDINGLDTFDKVTASYATFFDELSEALAQKDTKAYNALLTRLNAAGSDDLLLSLNTIMNGIDGLLSKPGISKRLADMIADGGKQKAA